MTDIPAAALRARQMYADGVSVAAIRAATGLTHHALYRWIAGRDGLPPLPKRRIVKKVRISAGDRISVIARIMRSAERQVAEIEKRIGTQDDQGDRDARALALLARTIRELTAVDAMNRDMNRDMNRETAQQARGRHANDEASDSVPHDVDALRRSLARKLEEIIAEGGDMLSGEAQSG
ncbi:MAG: hypothetical protein WA792_07500 [Pseudolabrys sp.]